MKKERRKKEEYNCCLDLNLKQFPADTNQGPKIKITKQMKIRK